MKLKAIDLLAICLSAVCLAGCSSGKEPDLRKRVEELEKENAALRKKIEQLSNELRPLRAKVDRLDQNQRLMEKTLVKAKEDLEARVTEIVQQRLGGGRFPRREPFIARVRFVERPYMGFDGQEMEPELAEQLELKAKTGVLVTNVREGSPAAIAGLKKNDVIQAFDGKEVKTFEDLKRLLAAKKPGQVVTMGVLRGDKHLTLKVKLGARRVPVQD